MNMSYKLIAPMTLSVLAMVGCQNATEQRNTDKSNEQKQSAEAQKVETPSQSDVLEQKAKKENQAKRTFEYTPKAPVDGKKMGIGAIGSSELTSLVVEIDNEKNWALLDRKDDKSLMEEGESDDTQIKKRLQNYLKGMKEEGVSPRNMHFIISSGAQKDGHAEPLIKTLKSSGYIVNIITPTQEAKYAFKSTVPAEYRTKSFMVDIGSGNTKISWEENGKLEAVDTYGAKYFQESTEPKVVYDEVKAIIDKIPDDKKKYCFIIGGVPYKLAKPIREDKQRFVVLNTPDSYTPENDKMKSGLNIYDAMVDSTGKDTQYVFDFNSHYAIGFLESLK